MKFLGYKRFRFEAQMYLPIEDPGGGSVPIMTYIKQIVFDFSDDPNAPRQVITCAEPLPVATQISAIKDRAGVEPIPGAFYNVTSVEPVIGPFGKVEVYRHQAALAAQPDFGYEGIQRA